MKYVFAYTRVSTAKQGSEGASLPEQKDSILRYCERNDLSVIRWFEETETAAKRGRTLYTEMMKLLEKGKAQGVVFHKIDRSTRNLGEWAEVSSLPERGIDVHYSHEPVDLTTNHGRTAADVAAVFASAYIRNLRDEVRKGIQGRLKQGLYPFKAPIGYLDNGKAKLKTIDPIKGPIIKEMFELYGSGEYSINSLIKWLEYQGVDGSRKGKILKHGVSIILHNPFYMGVIHIRRTGVSYPGNHEPLISAALFKRVQDVFTGRIRPKITKHKYQYQKLLTCSDCERVLVGETQKGHVYYRCHSCKARCYKQELFSDYLKASISKANTQSHELSALRLDIASHLHLNQSSSTATISSQKLQLDNLSSRLEKLTDAYLEGGLIKTEYDRRKQNLLIEKSEKEEQLTYLKADNQGKSKDIDKLLEQLISLNYMYNSANDAKKRNLVKLLSSNIVVSPKSIEIKWREPFKTLFFDGGVQSSPLKRPSNRTTSRAVGSSHVITESATPYLDLSSDKKRLRVIEVIDLITTSLPLLPNLPEYDILGDREADRWSDHPVVNFRRKLS